MNLAITHGRSTVSVYAQPVLIEVHLSNGLPSFTIVGLPETAVKESKDRVRSAIITSQFEFPCRKITINLAPADLPKMGSGFDLPIALGILAASGQISSQKLSTHEFIGELALDGSLRGITGIIPVIIAAHHAKHCVVIAKANAEEACLANREHVFAAENLRAVCSYLTQDTPLCSLPKPPPLRRDDEQLDWSDIKGQHHAKYALEIAAYGGHSVLLSGSPGSGKTMLATRFKTLLPHLSEDEALACAAIQSVRGRNCNFKTWRQPPFRSPHHSASSIALIGGGNPPKPGEISLAHYGVLFLDELPEFQRNVLESLREPLESGVICISRASMQSEFPAQFQLIAAMNPCPCGHWGSPTVDCVCTPERINRYIHKLSGPFLDRIDMQVNVHPLSEEELIKPHHPLCPTSSELRAKVECIRLIQKERQGCLNAHLNAKQMELFCSLGNSEQAFLSQINKKLHLSARSFHRLLKVARTIADVREQENIDLASIQQALSFKHSLGMSKIREV